MHILLINENTSLQFHESKNYNVGTGYIALHEEYSENYFLCRYLSDIEKGMYENTICLYEYESLSHLANNIRFSSTRKDQLVGRDVMIIEKHAQGFEQIDTKIKQLKLAFCSLPDMVSCF